MSLKVLRILCHKMPSLEMVVKDWIAGTKMIISDDDGWDWSDDGWGDPDDEEVSSQEFSSEDSDSDVEGHGLWLCQETHIAKGGQPGHDLL